MPISSFIPHTSLFSSVIRGCDDRQKSTIHLDMHLIRTKRIRQERKFTVSKAGGYREDRDTYRASNPSQSVVLKRDKKKKKNVYKMNLSLS